MNLNRLEERNLENRKKSIDKEQRTSISLINHEIKRLEVEYDQRQDLLKITENQEKINHLTEALNLNFLIDKNNDFLNKLGNETFELKSTENIDSHDKNQTLADEKREAIQVQVNVDKDESRPVRKNLSASDRTNRQGSKLRANSAHSVKESNNYNENNSNAINNGHVSPNVTLDTNFNDQNTNITPRDSFSRLSRPKSNTSLLNMEKIFHNSTHLEPSKIDINDNVITVQKLPVEYLAKTNTAKLNESSKRVKSPKKNLKRSKSQSAYLKKIENFLPDLKDTSMPNKNNIKTTPRQQNISKSRQTTIIVKEDSNKPPKEIILIKDNPDMRLNRTPSPTKLNRNKANGFIAVPLTVKTIDWENGLFKGGNRTNNLRENNSLPIIIKK
jgi:hypothetical protein